jgi:23S rRNA pseudouridine2604 synthase
MHLRIQRFLAQRLKLSNPEVLQLMVEKRVFINDKPAVPNQLFSQRDAVRVDDTVLQEAKTYFYFALNKPRGIECTTNPEIPGNIIPFLPNDQVYLVGRLDKDSEGLIFLTDDGKFYDAVADSSSNCEKEYYVETDAPIHDEQLQQLRSGIVIMGKKTRPCIVKRTGENSFNIILTQGLNRQIRRMCYKLGFMVTTLKRVRIGNVLLGDLKAGEVRAIGALSLKEL